VGAAVPASSSKAIADQAEVRAVRVASGVLQRVSITDLNVVTERLDGAAFDLMIATNVFVYYDILEQALAMSNVESMLRPGAYLLANVAAPPIRALTIRPVDTHTTLYARAPNNESILDFMVWYKAHSN
jgi:chemotaxis methyl-accepting protein methylase